MKAPRVVRRKGFHILLDNWLADGGKVVGLNTQAALYLPGRFLVLFSVRGWLDARAVVR
jgi:hypothetical protein